MQYTHVSNVSGSTVIRDADIGVLELLLGHREGVSALGQELQCTAVVIHFQRQEGYL